MSTSLTLEKLLDGDNYNTYPIDFKQFYSYLSQVELSVENLYFYFWYVNYKSKYHYDGISRDSSGKRSSTFDEKKSTSNTNNLLGPGADFPSSENPSVITRFFKQQRIIMKSEELEFRCNPSLQSNEDVDLCMNLFLNKKSKYELNIGGKEREALLQNINKSTHPQLFEPIFNNIYATLRYNSFPNFLKYRFNHLFKLNSLQVFLYAQFAFFVYIVSLVLIFMFIWNQFNSLLRLVVLPLWWVGSLMFLCVIYKFNLIKYVSQNTKHSIIKKFCSKKTLALDLKPNNENTELNMILKNYKKCLRVVMFMSIGCSIVITVVTLSIPPYKFW